jgi:hypothetical protein
MKAQVNKVKVMILTALMLIGLSAAGIIYYLNSPSGMLAIDVNPSLEIHTNHLGQVVSINPVNDDAVQLMAGYQLTDRNLETVIKDIVDRMILNGYLVNENTNEILLTGNKNSSDTLLNQATTSLTSYLQEKQLAVEVLNQKTDMDKEDVEAAHENQISVGKMALINALLKYDSSLTTEDLTHATIKNLIQIAHTQSIPLGQILKDYRASLADPTATAAPTEAASPTAAVTPTTAPDAQVTAVPTESAALDDQSVTGTIVISAGNKHSKDDAEENDLEDANEANEDQNDAEIENDNEDNDAQGNHEDANKGNHEKESSGKKSHKETASEASGTDAVSGASLNVNKDNSSSSDFEENDNEDNDNENSDFEENDNNDEDGGGYYQNGSKHEAYQQDNENEDGNSQGDEGNDD